MDEFDVTALPFDDNEVNEDEVVCSRVDERRVPRLPLIATLMKLKQSKRDKPGGRGRASMLKTRRSKVEELRPGSSQISRDHSPSPDLVQETHLLFDSEFPALSLDDDTSTRRRLHSPSLPQCKQHSADIPHTSGPSSHSATEDDVNSQTDSHKNVNQNHRVARPKVKTMDKQSFAAHHQNVLMEFSSMYGKTQPRPSRVMTLTKSNLDRHSRNMDCENYHRIKAAVETDKDFVKPPDPHRDMDNSVPDYIKYQVTLDDIQKFKLHEKEVPKGVKGLLASLLFTDDQANTGATKDQTNPDTNTITRNVDEFEDFNAAEQEDDNISDKADGTNDSLLSNLSDTEVLLDETYQSDTDHSPVPESWSNEKAEITVINTQTIDSDLNTGFDMATHDIQINKEQQTTVINKDVSDNRDNKDDLTGAMETVGINSDKSQTTVDRKCDKDKYSGANVNDDNHVERSQTSQICEMNKCYAENSAEITKRFVEKSSDLKDKNIEKHGAFYQKYDKKLQTKKSQTSDTGELQSKKSTHSDTRDGDINDHQTDHKNNVEKLQLKKTRSSDKRDRNINEHGADRKNVVEKLRSKKTRSNDTRDKNINKHSADHQNNVEKLQSMSTQPSDKRDKTINEHGAGHKNDVEKLQSKSSSWLDSQLDDFDSNFKETTTTVEINTRHLEDGDKLDPTQHNESNVPEFVSYDTINSESVKQTSKVNITDTHQSNNRTSLLEQKTSHNDIQYGLANQVKAREDLNLEKHKDVVNGLLTKEDINDEEFQEVKHKHKKKKTSKKSPKVNKPVTESTVDNTIWRLYGPCVIQISGIPLYGDMSVVMECSGWFGTVIDHQVRHRDDGCSIRIKYSAEEACDYAIENLNGSECFYPDAGCGLQCEKLKY